MALGHFQSHAVDSAGNVLAGATVTITNELTGGLAILKSDYAGASSKANGAGFTTDSDGYFDFYTTGGFYKIVVEKDGASKTWRYVAVGTLSGYDLDTLLNANRKTVRVATTTNITISTALNNGDTLDGVTLATGNLVLVKDQTNKYENGIYVVGVTPARHSDFDTYNEHVGAWIAASEGSTNANRLYVNTDNLGGTLNTTAINFTRVIPNGGSAPLDSPAFTGSFQWTGDISPTSLSADQDDYNPSGLSGAVVIRQATGAFYSINGLQGGSDGRVILIKNAGSNPLQIGAERASSTAAYRFAMSADLLLGPGETAMFEYDSTSSRWVLVGRKPRPEHLEVTPDPFPTVPHKPTVFADWSTMPWLDRYLTFTRASIASYTDRKGILCYAPAGVPRFHTIYSSGETGILIEGSRTNLLVRSGAFDNASWSLTALTISADSAVAPDGASTADKLAETNATSTHNATQAPSVTNGTTYTVSVFVKAAERGFALLALATAFPTTAIQINLSTGAVTTGTGTPLNAFSEQLPNGWWRVGFSLAATSTASANVNVYTSSDGVWGNRSYAGSTGSGIYAWGAQLEAGAFPSSYIPTAGSTVTRSADTLTRSDADGVINLLEHTLFAQGVFQFDDGAGGSRQLLSIDDGTVNERNIIQISSSADQANVGCIDGGVTQATVNIGSYTYGSQAKVIGSFAANNVRSAFNGTLGTQDTSATMPTVTRFTIGSRADGGQHGFGLLQKIAVWGTAQLSNANLQTVTT